MSILELVKKIFTKDLSYLSWIAAENSCFLHSAPNCEGRNDWTDIFNYKVASLHFF